MSLFSAFVTGGSLLNSCIYSSGLDFVCVQLDNRGGLRCCL